MQFAVTCDQRRILHRYDPKRRQNRRFWLAHKIENLVNVTNIAASVAVPRSVTQSLMVFTVVAALTNTM
jgi:hypothetical protein